MITSKTEYKIKNVSSFSSWGTSLNISCENGDSVEVELSDRTRVELRDMLSRRIKDAQERAIKEAKEALESIEDDES